MRARTPAWTPTCLSGSGTPSPSHRPSPRRRTMASSGHPPPAAGWVALVLAVGIATAINAITVAVLYDAIFSKGPGLSENATQVLTTAFGGIIGVLGAYVGYRG